jgi:hypothetical protein
MIDRMETMVGLVLMTTCFVLTVQAAGENESWQYYHKIIGQRVGIIFTSPTVFDQAVYHANTLFGNELSFGCGSYFEGSNLGK